MNLSRKRFRPLDPGEERALHTTDPLQLCLLEDERSYCFSWPTAPLTAWMKANLAYAETHIYKSAAAASRNAGGDWWAGGAAGHASGTTTTTAYRSDDGSVAPSAPILTPPVFSVQTLLHAGRGPDRAVGLHGAEEEGSEGAEAQLSARHGGSITVTSPKHSCLSTCEDVAHLLAPFALHHQQCEQQQLQQNHRAPGSVPALIVMTPESTPRVSAHPLSPPRPLCTGEDSIFSLNVEQLREATAAGLIRGAKLNGSCVEGHPAAAKDEECGSVEGRFWLAPKVELVNDTAVESGETYCDGHLPVTSIGQGAEAAPVTCAGRATNANACIYAADSSENDDRVERVRQRRRLEWEVVGLEWRAFKESQRTASALQRLLSLAAAVPFDPHPASSVSIDHSSTGGGSGNSAYANRQGFPGRTKDSVPPPAHGDDAVVVTEDWRRRVYQLWLHWRVGWNGGFRATEREETREGDGGASSGTRPCQVSGAEGDTGNMVSSPVSTFPFSPNYREPPTGMGGVETPQQHPWGTPLMPGAYLYDTQPDYFLNPIRTSAMTAGTTAVTAAAGGSAQRGGRGLAGLTCASARRRRGPYNFLSWKIELYTPQLAQLLLLPQNQETDEGVAGDNGNGDAGRGGRQRKQQQRGGGPTAAPLSLEHPAFAPIPTRRQRQQLQQQQLLRANDEDALGLGSDGRAISGSGGSGGGNVLLNSRSIDLLVRKVVLAHPLVELEQDSQSRQERLQALEWADLKRDTDMWRTWLSKV